MVSKCWSTICFIVSGSDHCAESLWSAICSFAPGRRGKCFFCFEKFKSWLQNELLYIYCHAGVIGWLQRAVQKQKKPNKQKRKTRWIFCDALKTSSFPRKARSKQKWSSMDRVVVYNGAAIIVPCSVRADLSARPGSLLFHTSQYSPHNVSCIVVVSFSQGRKQAFTYCKVLGNTNMKQIVVCMCSFWKGAFFQKTGWCCDLCPWIPYPTNPIKGLQTESDSWTSCLVKCYSRHSSHPPKRAAAVIL